MKRTFRILACLLAVCLLAVCLLATAMPAETPFVASANAKTTESGSAQGDPEIRIKSIAGDIPRDADAADEQDAKSASEKAAVTMKGSESDGGALTEPKLSVDSLYMNLYGYLNDTNDKEGYYRLDNSEIDIEGIGDDEEITVVSSDPAKLKVTPYTGSGFGVYPKAPGKFTVTATVAGKTLTLPVTVVNIYFKRNSKTVSDFSSKTWVEGQSMLALAKGETTALTLMGTSGHKVKYTSSDKSVASVDSKGNVKGKGYGYATITATVDDTLQLTYEVGVSHSRAIKALRYCVKHYGSTYSQPKRMQKGYYDCSSFVWYGYKAAGFALGNKNWAPTAAEEARWCVNNGYMMFEGKSDNIKLLPGDLIFWTGHKNGRYKGIAHVDIYLGNIKTMTVRRQEYYWDQTDTNIMVARLWGTSVGSPKASLKENTKVQLSWGKVYGATGYQIYRSTNKTKNYKKIATVKKGTTYKDSKCAANKTYYYKIRPYWTSRAKKTYYGKYSAVLKKKTKSWVPTLSVKKNAKKKVTLKWSKVSGAAGYVIYRKTGKKGHYKKIKTITKGSTVTFTNSKLKSKKTYYYKIKSYRKVNGKNVYSNSSKALKVIAK